MRNTMIFIRAMLIMLLAELRMGLNLVQTRPFHSIPTSGVSWTCQDGFYKTQPLLHKELATCRQCSNLTLQQCSASDLYIACSPLTDAQCVPCPPLPWPNISYAPGFHDCQVSCFFMKFSALGSLAALAGGTVLGYPLQQRICESGVRYA